MLPFSIVGWSVSHQDLDYSPLCPCPVPFQPDPLPWAWGGHPHPSSAGGTHWLLTQLLGHRCLPAWGSTLEVSRPRWGRGEALLQLLRGVFKHTTLLGRNLGRQRSLQQCLGLQQTQRTGAGILQGNREGVQRLCRVQVGPFPPLSRSPA